MNETVLIERLRQRDPGAFEMLIERFGNVVYRLAFGITRNASDAEEVAQDVFLTVFRKIESFEARAALGTWIYRITANTALNKRRGSRAGLEVSVDDLLPAYQDDGHRAGERSYVLADWSALPDEELLSTEGRRQLTRALEALPAAYRAVLILRDVDGLSNEETAAALGDSVASVKSRLHRARMALRELLTRAYADKASGAGPARVPSAR